ncbi:MAG: O-antigen ligase family protein [Silvibacterium sp.]|nr:O-antigen ligase family protein [Silvibacterium sp.]
MPEIKLQDLGCASILAFFAMQGAIPFIAPNQALESTHSTASGLTLYGGIASQALVYGTIAFLLLADLQRIIRWLGAMQWAAALSVLAVLSTIWSQFPLITLRRSLSLTMAGMFGLFLAVRFPLRRQLSILTMALGSLAAASALLAVCFPEIGLDASPGHHHDWQGVFTQKNACGRAMVLATAATISNWRLSPSKVASVGVFLFVLFMSGSRGAWAIEAVLLAFCGWLVIANRLPSRSRLVSTAASACAVAGVSAVAAYHLPLLLAFIGRDVSLSGRTEIWKQTWRFVLERPISGWGYAAFWRGLEGRSFDVAVALRFIVFHAHNGFLEIWLELGLPGLALFTLSYVRAWRKLWPVLRSGDIRKVVWMALVLVLILLYNLDENTLLTFNGLGWVLYVSVLANVELIGAEDRLRNVMRRILQPASAPEFTYQFKCTIQS